MRVSVKIKPSGVGYLFCIIIVGGSEIDRYLITKIEGMLSRQIFVESEVVTVGSSHQYLFIIIGAEMSRFTIILSNIDVIGHSFVVEL